MHVNPNRHFMGRLATGGDLLAELNAVCRTENIRLGAFTVIGAVRSACMGYYDQPAKKYVDCVKLEKKLEITACVGNISLMDGDIFVHAHITLADLGGQCYGGHLMPGTTIFAAEYHIQEFTGTELTREYDEETGLRLWEVC